MNEYSSKLDRLNRILKTTTKSFFVPIMFVILVLIFFLAVSSAIAVNCWDLSSQDSCINESKCRWDFWGQNCHEIGCWDLWDQSDCSDAGSTMNLSCSWKNEGSSGWCEDGKACWNYDTNSSCTATGGCTWEGSAYCREINCWNYNAQTQCEAHSSNGCSWDGMNCMESTGCWNSKDENTCDSTSGCMWKSNAYCAMDSCWNYDDEDNCNSATLGCIWEYDDWKGRYQCMDAQSCWIIDDEPTCDNADCYWDSTHDECEMKDCFMFGGTDTASCESNGLGLSCSWEERCEPDGPGGENCWNYNTSGDCSSDPSCEWGSCMMAGCWDETTQVDCEGSSLECQWQIDEYSSNGGYCQEQGCWTAQSSDDCTGISGCSWLSDAGWCEEEGCWNYEDENSCSSSSLSCSWTNDSWNSNGGWCSSTGCWNWNNQSDCEANSENGATCVWEGSWCERPGCWDYASNATCAADTNCEWDTSGNCFEEGCWSYATKGDCVGNSCTWGGSGWCEQQGCWNYDAKSTCDNQTACTWNDQYSYCEEVDCYGLATQTACEGYNSSLKSCYWDGYSCHNKGCWNYANTTTCSDADSSENCNWNSWEGCITKDCWNYQTNATCVGDSSCAWNNYCTGDYSLECWNYNNDSACSSAGCKWDGNCYKLGCWSNEDRSECCGSSDCTESGDCGWEDSGWCKGTGCWDYFTNGTCVNATSMGCAWDSTNSYCYEKSCWTYLNSTTCEDQRYRGCAWDAQNSNCKETGCWDYGTESQCQANNDSGCAWDTNGDFCYDEGCWGLDSNVDCNAQDNCEWQATGWCYDLGCWNYGTENDCTNKSQCSWDSTWEYCYEKGCWDYSTEDSCNATTKCSWDSEGSYCYEQGCWNYGDIASCMVDSDCQWDNSSTSGWCEETGCWDYNSSDCILNSCLWDSTWNYCYEAGCWTESNSSDCDVSSSNCYWNEGSGGWCYEEGCWDFSDQASCEGSSGCLWEATYEYCYEEGCWSNDDIGDCGAAGCTWTTSSWGWCEEVGCWNYYGDQTACENASDAVNCVWNSPFCDELACWAYDGDSNACTVTAAANGLNCTYSNGWCEPAGGLCDKYTGNKKECMDTKYCVYNFNTDECEEPAGETGFAEDSLEFNPECWLFDLDNVTCDNVTICQFNTSTSLCDNGAGFEGEPVQCENITNMTICNSIPSLGACCKWRNSQCTTDYTTDDCHENIDEPPKGASFCDDYNSYTSQELCEQIAGFPWYMPCQWSGQYCEFRFDDVVGTNGDYFDIKTEDMCKKAKGDWQCEDYCDDNGTSSNADDQLKSECWCQMGSGNTKQICAKSCWACEDQNNGTSWGTALLAQDACESSKANCEFEENSEAPNGFGYCDFSASTKTSGGCDSSCSACNDVADDPQTATPERKIACLESSAECKWAANLANKSKGKCQGTDKKTCLEDCFKCSETECESYGLNGSGNCEYDSTEEFCKPAKFLNDEICFNDKDDDNDNMEDCDDPDCFFSSDCGEGGQMHTCYNFDHNVTLCALQPTGAGSTLNCTWIQDPFGGQWCGHPSEVCWQYDHDQTQCGNQSGACKYQSMGGRCDINRTKAESCFGKAQAACTGDCQWESDPNDPFGGGRCEFKMFGLCHDPDITTQSGCTSGDNQQYCSWKFDSNAPNGGWCEPKCFNLDNNVSCISNSKCEWVAGWCEPNVSTSQDCYQFDNTDQNSCEGTGACTWEAAWEGGECEPTEDGSYVNSKFCDGMYWTNVTCNADVDCVWLEDEYSGQGGFCENKAFACFEYAMDSGDPETTCNGMAAYGCVWTGSECEHVCWYNASQGETCGADTLTECQTFTGWCDPKGAGAAFKGMDTPPVMVAFELCDESDKTPLTDICGMGVKDDFDTLGLGIGVRDMTDAAACNGEYIMDFSTFPPTMNQGEGSDPMKVEFYLDSDGSSTGGCSSSNGAKQGLEYKVVLDSTSTDKEGLSKYKCTNSQWETSTITVFTMAKIMCGEAGGPMIVFDKESMFEAGAFDLSYDLNLYVITKNTTSGAAIDALEGRYTPGTVNFMVEDCLGFNDMDGDGLPPDKDPDCKFMKQHGGMKFEDCFAAGDEDQDGLTNCDDPECIFMPACGGTIDDFTADSDDTTSASVTQYEVDTFPDGAFVRYDTDEPANGTLSFYYNDSACGSLNKTILDIGITDSNIPAYRLRHDGPIDEANLGYTLSVNTSFYYKLKVCDKSGNPCAESACLNFTTQTSLADCGIKCQPVFDVQYVAPEDDEFLSGTGMQWDFGEGYEDKPCGGQGRFKKNYSKTKNMGLKIQNDNGTTKWSIEFNNMSATGAVNSNKTTLEATDLIVNTTEDGIDYVGMDHDAWNDLKDELNPKTVDICVPGNVETLYYCSNDSAVSTSDCTDVTSSAVAGPTYNSALDCTEFTVPADLGFSVYFGSSSGGNNNNGGGGGGGGGTTPQCRDGTDNDGDGLIDMADKGCMSSSDNSEDSDRPCNERWMCGAWKECTDGKQIRTCVDVARCNSEDSIPATEQACTVEVESDESDVPEIQGAAVQEPPAVEPDEQATDEASLNGIALLGAKLKDNAPKIIILAALGLIIAAGIFVVNTKKKH